MKTQQQNTRISGALRLSLGALFLAVQACGGGGGGGDSAGAGTATQPPPETAAAPAPVAIPANPPSAAPSPAPSPAPAPTAGAGAAPPAGTLVALDASTTCGLPGFRDAVLQRVNAARASGQMCGAQTFAPAKAVVWNDILFSAAARHSLDMANRNYFSHTNPEGKSSAQRAASEGYAWNALGENIAGGQGSVDSVVAGWLASEGHCRNIMNPVYADIATACVSKPGTQWTTYWTMVLGRR